MESIHADQLVVGLDIGTTKIAVLVGKRTNHGKIDILAVGRSESLGVKRGVVFNIEETVNSIRLAVEEAEKRLGMPIKKVNVGIAGQHIKSMQHRGLITRGSLEDEISHQDVYALIEDMYKLVMQPGEEIIHVLPQEYIVDNESGIKSPVGMSGIRLEAYFHIITGHVTSINNLARCVKRAGLEVEELTLEPIASADAVLSDEEKEAGVALVDIGGGTTDIAIFQDGIIRHTAVIPFGGNIISEDIRDALSIIRNQAELLKVKFGSALASENQENEIVSIPGLRGREPKEISMKNLANVIEARMDEILDHVLYEIRNSGFERKLIAGIVLTGGGAQLKHLTQLMEYKSGLDVRIGFPTEHLASGVDDLKSPTFATGVGLVIHAMRKREEMQARTAHIRPNVESSNAMQTPEPPSNAEQAPPPMEPKSESLLDRIKRWLSDDVR